MEKNVNKALDNFIDDPNFNNAKNNEKKVVVKERSGLIERVDRTLITKDGRQLLREHY